MQLLSHVVVFFSLCVLRALFRDELVFCLNKWAHIDQMPAPLNMYSYTRFLKYCYVLDQVCKFSIKECLNERYRLLDLITNISLVEYVAIQSVIKRVKRDLFEPSTDSNLRSHNGISSESTDWTKDYANDPHWHDMWYLHRGNGLDMNIHGAWQLGYTGSNVVVTILDDGVEPYNKDLESNYDRYASYDINDNDIDPTPRYDFRNSNKHGTRCAGVVAGQINNSFCAIGVAYNAKIGGIRMLDGDITDAVEAKSLSLNPDHIDIYSASWGPDDDGETVDGPGPLARTAFMTGVYNGRGGLGSVFVWASGNGGKKDNCNCDGYTNSIWTLSISSATENGEVPWYSETCSSTLATTYSSGNSYQRKIVTTDLKDRCTTAHTGTSASAPLAAGICALALQANPKLSWRDMQHIVVRTARRANLKASDWVINGVGRHVSHSFGYGLMDATAMVKLAKRWITVPEQKWCTIVSQDVNQVIKSYGGRYTSSLRVIDEQCPQVKYLEHVQARITVSAWNRGYIVIYLTSPSGTTSTLLEKRPKDKSRSGFNDWPFMTTHNWDESPQGVWNLTIVNDGRHSATISNWKLIIFGTELGAGNITNSHIFNSDHSHCQTIELSTRLCLGLLLSNLYLLHSSVAIRPF